MLSTVDLASSDLTTIRSILGTELGQRQLSLVEVYRVTGRETPPVAAVVEAAAPSLPPGFAPAVRAGVAHRLGRPELGHSSACPPAASCCAASAPIRPSPDAPPIGVVIASVYLTDELARHSARIVEAYEDYTQLLVLRQPIEGVYLSFFLGLTLLILISATWMGLFLAKRITRPVQRLAAGAREIGAGHLDHRIEPDTHDEFGALVEAFNTMAGELASSSSGSIARGSIWSARASRPTRGGATSRPSSSASPPASSASTRRATSASSTRWRGGCSRSTPTSLGGRRRRCSAATTCVRSPSSPACARAARTGPAERTGLAGRAGGHAGNGGVAVAMPPDTAAQHEVTLVRDGHERHLLAATTTLGGDGGALESVLVFDDVTPLIRAQKVAAWRDVARRLAHEIKNPLTPIQLSRRAPAAALRRRARADARGWSTSAPDAIVAEVESLKGLVDEFSQFARMPAPKAVPTDLQRAARRRAGALRRPAHARDDRADGGARSAAGPARSRAGPARRHQPRRQRRRGAGERARRPDVPASAAGMIAVDDRLRRRRIGVVRLRVADNGPGLAAGDRSKLFLPYYSTKGRGSGLGLAIVRRIVAEHGGSIEAADNAPARHVLHHRTARSERHASRMKLPF